MRKHSHYQPRAIAIPMTARNKQHVELTFYADLVGFISAPTDTGYNRLMRTLQLITLAMQEQAIEEYDVQLRSAIRAMASVFGRWQHTAKITVLELEALTLRAAAPTIEQAHRSHAPRRVHRRACPHQGRHASAGRARRRLTLRAHHDQH